MNAVEFCNTAISSSLRKSLGTVLKHTLNPGREIASSQPLLPMPRDAKLAPRKDVLRVRLSRFEYPEGGRLDSELIWFLVFFIVFRHCEKEKMCKNLF